MPRQLKKWILFALLMASAAVSGACACDAVLIHGIGITIVDDETGNPVEGDVTVIATDGSYSETVNPPFYPGVPRTVALAPERPGRYRVEIQAPGYVTFVMPSVLVRKDDCHVEPVQLTARLAKPGAG
jgi:hypothetical protein